MQDLRFAVRSLRSTPIVTTVAILSLALGIGANTAIFSLVDSLVLRTLPVVAPQQLVMVSTPRAGSLGSTAAWPYAVWDEIRRTPNLFADVAAWGSQRFNLAQHGETEFVDGVYVSGSFFHLLGVPAILGRTITEDDDRRGGGPDGAVAVISCGFWQRRFGGAADAIGRTLTIEQAPFTIVGVTPPWFFGTDVGRTFDVIVPVGDEPLMRRETRLDARSFYWLTIIGRLRAGQTIDQAAAALKAVEPHIRDATLPPNVPKHLLSRYLSGREGFAIVPAATGNSGLRNRYERPLVTIFAVVALVLLVACTNIANVLLARATARRHEAAVRRALGASPWRLARQFLVESAILAVAGAVAGLAFASAASRLLIQQLSTTTNAVFLDVSLNRTVLMFTLAVATITVVVFGAVPALRASAVHPSDALKEHGRGAVGTGGASTANAFVIAQVALSLILVVAAALFLRTFVSLGSRPVGFDANHILLVNVNSQRVAIDAAQRPALYERIRDSVSHLPGVAAAGLSFVTPIQGGGIIDQIQVSDGATVLPTLVGGIGNVYGNVVSPGWFNTLGIPLLAGRDFSETDRSGAAPVAVVNQAFARAFLNGASPIGHTLTHLRGTRSEIVGVVADSLYGSLREPAMPTYYEPLAQAEVPPTPLPINLSIRTTSESPAQITKSVAADIDRIQPDLATTFRPLSDQVDAALVQERLTAILGTFFGALALVLAGLGLYGVTAYAVARRRGEIGIRLALGAAPIRVVRLVLSRVAGLVGVGILLGGLVSAWASQFVNSLLYGVTPRDPLTFAAAIATLVVVAAVAGWLPARRASRIDPAEALRET
ncbi:MAG TPA: ABC transporter permease [Vicinamibacterales bacterium]